MSYQGNDCDHAAYTEGISIQVSDKGEKEWYDADIVSWDWRCNDYRIKPKTFEIGDTFVNIDDQLPTPEVFVLYQVAPWSVCLISLTAFNRWSESIEVKDPYKITEAELKKTFKGAVFVPYQEKK